MTKCIIHHVTLDKFVDGSYGCLICWKNKGTLKELGIIKAVWDNKEFSDKEYIEEINRVLEKKNES